MYKYVKWNEYTFDSIKNNTLFFSKPSCFNDPFDFGFYVNESEFHDKTIYDEYGKLDEKLKDQFHQNFYGYVPYGTLYEDLRQTIIDLFAVCCFSKIKDNILMFSHYSDRHRGICLCYDFDILLGEKHEYWDVEYNNDFPVLDVTDILNRDNVKKIYANKAVHWSYENEVRLIEHCTERNDIKLIPEGLLWNYPEKALVEVIIGCKMNGKNIKQLKDLLRSKSHYIELYQAYMNLTKYKLESTKLEY
ncbi:MAG TPA: DUF2971 domain-containing protein [Candidatus Cloacimonadota bacterium]|nr:DUF2971 domain-containing protein [Candidatus Cloacimonadota bacterium]